ncbi:hypothetical protein MED15_05267 [Micromonospora noduli]|uniref:Histidine kinase n=1 Tax=Micromonospora noduli TaxID=709876 RepID=A0ABX9CWX4_9ACTN|nr:hypothetical protein [Micromonospora noduli]RAO11577.1 hypothetical protein MED15_05267 [Micromonospora noduli]
MNSWTDPLAVAFLAEFCSLILLLLAPLTLSGRAASVMTGVLAVVVHWALPYAYLGREHSVREDRSLLGQVRIHDALSVGDVPTHPWWWKEGGKPGRPLIRLAVLATVPVSIASVAFHGWVISTATTILPDHYSYLPVEDGDLPTLLWGVGWLASFGVLSWARSTRRRAFRAAVDALVERENLDPHLSERDRLHRETTELKRQRAELGSILKSLRETDDAARSEGVPPGLRITLDRLVRLTETALSSTDVILKRDQETTERADAERRQSIRRERWMLVIGALAGLLLAILSHQVGLT